MRAASQPWGLVTPLLWLQEGQEAKGGEGTGRVRGGVLRLQSGATPVPVFLFLPLRDLSALSSSV